MRRLRPHQMTALFYSRRAKNPGVFLDMRLGKTLVTIRRLLTYEPRDKRRGLRVLVVAPNPALDAWRDELPAEGIEYNLLSGPRSARLKKLEANDSRFYLINKEGWLAVPEIGGADRCEACKGRGKVPDGDTKRVCYTCRGKGYNQAPPVIRWDAAILDESVFIKNARARVTKFFLNSFWFVPHRWALTGLPNPEGSLDYICQMLWLNHSFMGFDNYWAFRAKYYKPDPRGYGWVPKPGVNKMINEEVGRTCLIMRRKDVNLEVDKIRQTRTLELSPKARKTYDKAERDFILEGDGLETESTLWRTTQYIWLRRLAGGVIDGKPFWSGKLNELKYLLTTELAKDPVVVWFNFNDEINEALKVLGMAKVKAVSLTGNDSPDVRRRVVREFRAGNVRVLLLQSKIAQYGLNLGAADTAIYFSEPVALNDRRQTEERILELGKRSLLLINLIVKDTVDEDVNRALRLKGLNSNMSLSAALLTAMRERRGY